MRNTLILKMMLFVSILISFSQINAKTTSLNVNRISYLDIESAITPATLQYLQTEIPNIPDESLIIIRLNTPGGLVQTTKEIISTLSKHSAPKVVWVTPSGGSAASAGAIMSAASDFIVMTPGTTIGAATPVGMGQDIDQGDAKSKIMNDLVALVEGLSVLRGHPKIHFKDMIVNAKSFSDDEAKRLGISLGSVSSTQDILDLLVDKTFSRNGVTYQLSFSNAIDQISHEKTFYQSILSVLAEPQLAYILFLLGVALLYFELQAPGGYIAGGLGFLCLLISAMAFQVLPLNWVSFGLIILGIILFVLEIYITSYGLLSLGGVISLTLGSLYLFEAEGAFITPPTTIILSTLFAILTVMGALSYFLIKKSNKNQISFFSPVGEVGIVLGRTSNYTQVRVNGQIWNATSNETLNEGDIVVIDFHDEKNLELKVSKK